MIDVLGRIGAVESDIHVAFDRLRGVLALIQAAKPRAEIRVVVSNNVIVSIVSTLEEGLRNLLFEYLSILEDGSTSHVYLRKTLQMSNLDRGVGLLKKASDLEIAGTLIETIANCLKGENPFQLFKPELTYNDRNFRSKQVSEVAKNCGIEQIWTKISDAREIEEYTGESSLETRQNKLIQAWNEIFEERDIIVHRISQATGWSEDRILETMNFSLLVIQRVVKCLVDDAVEFLRQVELMRLQGLRVSSAITNASTDGH